MLDTGEAGLSGITVRLTQNGSTIANMVTDSSGAYAFTGLTAGTYQVEQVPPPPAGFTPALSGPQTVTITVAQAAGTVTKNIDTFNQTMQMVEASLIAGPTDGSSAVAPEALGGERDLFVRLNSVAGGITLAANANLPGVLDFGTLFGAAGEARVTWDGFDGDPDAVDSNGLTGTDRVLSANGATHFQFQAGSEQTGGMATIRVYSGPSGATSQTTFSIPLTSPGTTEEVLVPFASFAGADFGDVGAVELILDPQNTADGAFDSIGLLAPEFVTQNFPNEAIVDLVLNKTVSDDTPELGDAVTFTITVSNSGPADATGVEVTDLLPAGMTLTNSVPSQGSYSPTTGVWTVNDLANGGFATLQLTGTVDTLGKKTNNATITAVDQRESSVANNDAMAMATPFAIDLSVVKSVSEMMPDVGEPFTFTIQVTNNAVTNSPATTATNVTIRDQLPSGVNFVNSNASQGSYNAATDIWNVGSLDVGVTANLTIVATADTTNKVTNTASLNSLDQRDIVAANNQDAVMIMPVIPPAPAIRVVKRTNSQAADTSLGGPLVLVGTTVTFTYNVTNTGNVPLANVQVVDDNGTENEPSDDFFASYVSGDSNSDDLLDVTENWLFQAQRAATQGRHINQAQARGTGAGQTVTDDTVSNHAGLTPLGKRSFLASRFRYSRT